MIRLVAVFSMVAAFNGPKHEHCGHNQACIERVAARSCSTLHDHHHCMIWHRWQWRLANAYHAFRAQEDTVSPSSTVVGDPAPTPSVHAPSSSDYSDVPGVPASFAACVALRESTDGAGSSNIYGIEGPGGQGTLEQQKEAFAQMYAARGTEPWSQYDGC